MKENTQDKMLIEVNENSIFYRIKKFFRSLFSKKERNITPIENQVIATQEIANKRKESFEQSIKNIENDETKLLKLQKQYRTGNIKSTDLTREQIISLGKLYDSQISKLKKSNEIRKQKLLEYRRKLQADN